MPHCPECHSERIRRSKRRGIIERGLLTVVWLKPFRCADCNHRFFLWPVKDPSKGGLFAALWPQSRSSQKHQPFFM
jgi:hypothetical protein